ncbi:MAG TPA: cytochrome c oxidase assembly protein [Thermoanaerobaculia bacterium]|nr:cytochrome c oxidase assembly protein [Thermoanaerobaculia bacterium]
MNGAVDSRPARRVPLVLGLLVLAACWLGPLPALAKGSFAAHMTMHMGVVALGTGLVALGLAGSRLDPARHWPRWFAPIPASGVEAVVVWAWHAPVLHHAARHRPEALLAEQGSFLAAGLFLWLSAFGGEPDRGGTTTAATTGRAAAGVLGLLLTSMHMTLLGALLALTPRPLYAHGGAGGALGLAALTDQHLGGAIMLLVGGVSYLAGGLWLTAGVLRGGGWRGARGSANPGGRRADAVASRIAAGSEEHP